MSAPAQAFLAAIAAMCGHAPEVIVPGTLQRFSTNGRRGDTAGWCKLFDDQRAGVFGCHRQGIEEKWFATDRNRMSHAERALLARQVAQAQAERQNEQRRQWAENAQRIAKLWAECRPLVPGDTATLYMKHRGFGGVWPLPACLRMHPGLPYWHEGQKLGKFPAMVAPLVAPNGRTVALHRTFLTLDGKKAAVHTVKKLTPATGLLKGACIPLFKPESRRIGIAEGIETALAAWILSDVPTVAAYCADNLEAWQWPVGVRSIVIFADADEAGAKAADALQQRARGAGLSCSVLRPTTDDSDWCDVLAGRDAAMIEGASA